MKISLNWLKKYVDVKVSDEELIRLIGARLVEVEGVIDETQKYDNIYVVRVESCEKIPDTHLTLCRVNAGQAFSGDGSLAPVVTGQAPSVSAEPATSPRERPDPALIQVVCGAPNVREGMLAAWIAPGATVPASVHEDAPFVIGTRKMRGFESHGMLAGADELDFGDDHSGIVGIDPEMAKPGELFKDVFELSDLILEIENKSLTHRPDCFGLIGFAREVSGILGEKFALESASHKDLAVEPIKGLKEMGDELGIVIEDTGACKRYSALVLEKHGEAKEKYLTWVDTVLSKAGMRPVSPVVDATNYLMLLTGQPLHAFDYDKFVAVGKTEKPEIRVRLARQGEKLVLIDEKEVELGDSDIVICSGDVPVALAGAMGGKSTEIDESTRKIILESATFSLYNLRKTQMAHGIFSEAITRFTKGQPPYQTLQVARMCAGMLSDGYKAVGEAEEYPEPEKKIVVKITTDEINALLGTEYSDKLIVETLSNVGFVVSAAFGGKSLSVGVPEWRTDIHIKEDVIEEVGRLLGYDNILPTLPLHGTASYNPMLSLKRSMRELMAKYGANEVLTYSFVSENLMKKVGQDTKNAYEIVNSISPDLQYERQSIVPSLLEKAFVNQKKPVEQFAMYEMNKVYRKEWGMTDEGVPVEKMSFGFVVAERKNINTAYYKAKKYVAKICEEFGVAVQFLPLKSDDAVVKPFEKKRSAMVMIDGEFAGVVGEFKNSVRNEFKLMPYLAGFEIDMDLLLRKMSPQKEVRFGKYEKRDLTVATDETYEKLVGRIQKVLDGEGAEARILPGMIYQPIGQPKKHITVHLKFAKFDENVMKKLEKL